MEFLCKDIAPMLMLALLLMVLMTCSAVFAAPWQADNGDGTYKNPVLYADYSDPDVIRVGENFYMVASSFNCMPGIPVLQSKDLVNWTIVSHVYDRLPLPKYDAPAHGQGCWAPSIRHHAGRYYVYFCTPEEGLFMSSATSPAGPWEPLTHVLATKGWEDPCPLWDDDGQAYLVHSKLRGGPLILHKMSPDGKKLLDDGKLIFQDDKAQPTLEGPKFCKRNGYYYIFAPAGGVAMGWQTVLRARNVYGPYEARIVLEQGNTKINGPHQGGYVETPTGEGWFMHFQDVGVAGRIVHLQPVRWVDDWPIIGQPVAGKTLGQPVPSAKKPNLGKSFPLAVPQTSDEFDQPKLGLQWQWHANPKDAWASLTQRPGSLRLFAQPVSTEDANLWYAPNLLLQKLPAPKFTVTTRMTFRPTRDGDRAGLVIMGEGYAYIALRKTPAGQKVAYYQCDKVWAGNGGAIEVASSDFTGETIDLRMTMDAGICTFSFSPDGKTFTPLGKPFTARPGKWIGAKVGLFCVTPRPDASDAQADFDWFRYDP